MTDLIELSTDKATEVTGLSSAEAAKRLEQNGENRLAAKKKTSPLKIFANQFHDIMVMILLAATVISLLLGQYTDAIPIILIVVINAFLGFFQEYRCEKTLEKLESMTAPTATVFRDWKRITIPAAEAVEGDVFEISAGDRVPCDAYINSASHLSCDESVLTGEAVPAEKTPRQSEVDFSQLNCSYMVYMGTVVTKGSAICTATSTGQKSQMGKVSKMLESIDEPVTPLQKKLAELGKTLAIICLAVCVIVFIAGVLRGEPILDMAMTGITIAIAAIPEGLPATVTIALALAVRKMLKRNALVHKLHSVETLGCATVICTDKTGTVTMNKMTVTDVMTFDGEATAFHFDEADDGIISSLGKRMMAWDTAALGRLMLCGAACNNALPAKSTNKKGGKYVATGDPTEAAVLIACSRCGISSGNLGLRRTDEIPFDSSQRYMTVICKDEHSEITSFKKGSADVIISSCGYSYNGNGTKPLSPQQKLSLMSTGDRYAARGLRVLAFSEIKDGKEYFLGFMAMKDPLRPEARAAVLECEKAGIKTVMITGDHKLTAISAAKEAGIMKSGSLALTGKELDKLSDEELSDIIDNCAVFARVSPEHKLRIVRIFKAKGHVCAMTGDGVNDAPAVKEADIGVSMGIQGTEVTKQAADVILLDDNFATLVSAAESGRTIYSNIRKFVRYLISCNIGEVLTMLGGIIMGLPMVLVPSQILLVNLVTDSLPAAALGLEPPEDTIMSKPPRKEGDSFFSGGLLWRIVFRGILIGLVTLASFTMIYSDSHSLEAARTGTLITLVMSQLIHVFECRSEEKNFLKINPLTNKFLLFSVVLSAAVLFAGIYIPFLQKIFMTCIPTIRQLILSLGLAFAVPIASSFANRKKLTKLTELLPEKLQQSL